MTQDAEIPGIDRLGRTLWIAGALIGAVFGIAALALAPLAIVPEVVALAVLAWARPRPSGLAGAAVGHGLGWLAILSTSSRRSGRLRVLATVRCSALGGWSCLAGGHHSVVPGCAVHCVARTRPHRGCETTPPDSRTDRNRPRSGSRDAQTRLPSGRSDGPGRVACVDLVAVCCAQPSGVRAARRGFQRVGRAAAVVAHRSGALDSYWTALPVAWICAIGGTTLLPALLGQHFGAVPICIDGCGYTITTDNPGPNFLVAAMFFWLGPFIESQALGALIVGFVAWSQILIRFGPTAPPPAVPDWSRAPQASYPPAPFPR